MKLSLLLSSFARVAALLVGFFWDDYSVVNSAAAGNSATANKQQPFENS